MTFAAVVVSFNRRDLLMTCLEALRGQTRALDEIIVVDNGSTDGSPEAVLERFPEMTLFRTGKNLGGAGGFAWGVELAMAKGHQGAWLMDDDAAPELDAVAPLIELFETLESPPAFVSSLVTSGRDNPNVYNTPTASSALPDQMTARGAGAIAVDNATFVGVMINLEVARRTHLPLLDYFIWMDDIEYTTRLRASGLGFTVPSSMINHPDKSASADRGPRLFYYIRNRFWMIKDSGDRLRTGALDALGLFLFALSQFRVAASKSTWAKGVVRGFWEGIVRRPRHFPPGSLLTRLPADVRSDLGV